MTFAEAVGRIFDYKGKKFYVVKSLWGGYSHAAIIDLETSTEVFIYDRHLTSNIPPEWKEILP